MTKVYVGNLPIDIRERELEDLFARYGKIRFVDIKCQGRPPAYAFVDFADPRDAQDAVRGRDGIEFAGNRLRVEIAKGGTGMARDNFRPPRSSGHRVYIRGLPKGCSWQDLKDHVRTAVRPNYTDVRTDPEGNVVGVVEFDSYEDMKLAIRKLDDTEFNNSRYDRGHYVRYEIDGADRDDRKRSRSRTRSPRRRDVSASPDRDRQRDRERDDRRARDESPRGRGRDMSVERNRDRDRSASRSVSRSRSRSRSP